MCTQAECEAAYDGLCQYCTDDNVAADRDQIQGDEVACGGLFDEVVCQASPDCVGRFYNFDVAIYPISGLLGPTPDARGTIT